MGLERSGQAYGNLLTLVWVQRNVTIKRVTASSVKQVTCTQATQIFVVCFTHVFK